MMFPETDRFRHRLPDMDAQTIDYYNQNAASVSARYESVESPFSALLPYIFERGSRVLDVGCGSGRDLSLILHRGFDAVGIEAAPALADQAISIHPELTGKIRHGVLPHDIPSDLFGTFDGILLSAVLMHIPDSGLFDTAIELRRLLKPGGTLLVSIPVERDDLSCETDRDGRGRLMVLRPVPKVKLLFERIGFETAAVWNSADVLGRRGVAWISIQFIYHGGGRAPSIDRIEGIINRDAKVATYKLALLRSFCDIAQHESGIVRWDEDGRVGIPIEAVAEKWIEYYWPLIESETFIPQIGGEKTHSLKPISIRKPLAQLVSLYTGSGGLGGFILERDSEPLPDEIGSTYRRLLSTVKTAIKKPVFYSGGGAAGDKPFEYDHCDRLIHMDGDLWRELVLLGHLIHDSIVLRWAEESSRMSKGTIAVSTVLDRLLVSGSPAREVSLAREVYGSLGPLEYVWSGNTIRQFAVDHAIPFSLWRDNSLWNLLPASPAVNNSKRDKLPETDLLRRRKDAIIYYWDIMKRENGQRFQKDTIKIAGNSRPDPSNWEDSLFTGFIEAMETTAARRGAARWDV